MSWVICDTRGHTCITFTEDDASTNNMYYIMAAYCSWFNYFSLLFKNNDIIYSTAFYLCW